MYMYRINRAIKKEGGGMYKMYILYTYIEERKKDKNGDAPLQAKAPQACYLFYARRSRTPCFPEGETSNYLYVYIYK